ncbi:hypothetical protein [Fodinibius sp. AD559]|uniref:hypothetical protein n=1 Tax=Fodinibius sp. AD559 TaxID=3424179 RepID=UPI004046EA5D
MRIVLFLLLFVFTGESALSQSVDRVFKDISEKENHYEIHVSDGTYRFQFYTPDIVETSFIPEGETFQEKSHAVVMSARQVDIDVSQTDSSVVFQTKGITARIQKAPFQIAYYRGNKLLIKENGYSKDSLETIQFGITEEEPLYGGGARALNMSRRGYRLELYNRAHYGYGDRSELLNYTMPVVL